MPAKAYPLSEWTPDLANNVLSRAVNVRAIANGYAPVKGPQTVTYLPGTFAGGGSFIDSTGVSTLLAAAPTTFWRYTASGWIGIGPDLTTGRHYLAQFGDNVLYTSGPGAALLSYNLVTTASNSLTAAPNAIDIARVRDFVMVITDDNKVRWCQFNDSSNWTLGTNQADEQPILDSSGVRLIGGEYGVLLKKVGIARITYVGSVNDIIFQFDEIAPEIGVMAAGSVCNVGRLIFFLSERGFEMCDGQTVTPVGDEKFNRWFFRTFSRADIANIWASIDPRNSCVLWAMPGTPGTIICYNWVLQEATTFELDVTGLMTGYSTAIPLEALDALYGNLDAMTISLDDPSLQGGNPVLLIADGATNLAAMTGDNLEAAFQLDNIEPTPGRRSRIRSLRLVSDALDASATLNARMRIGDGEGIVSTSAMRDNGKLPIRSNGRYNDLGITIPAGTDWTFIQGCEIEFEPGDAR